MTPACKDEARAKPGRLRLGEYPGEAVRIVCRRCGRDGQHDLPRLLALFGPHADLAQVLARLADCGRQQDWLQDGPCWAEFTAMPAPTTSEPRSMPRHDDLARPPARPAVPAMATLPHARGPNTASPPHARAMAPTSLPRASLPPGSDRPLPPRDHREVRQA